MRAILRPGWMQETHMVVRTSCDILSDSYRHSDGCRSRMCCWRRAAGVHKDQCLPCSLRLNDSDSPRANRGSCVLVDHNRLDLDSCFVVKKACDIRGVAVRLAPPLDGQ